MTQYYKGYLIVTINGRAGIYRAGQFQAPANSPASARDWVDQHKED